MPLAIENLRQEYRQAVLNEADAKASPLEQFQDWLQQALAAELPEPHAMTLATVSPEGLPSARTVLLRSVDSAGFVFYTNYQSRKGRDIAHQPGVCLLFYWPELERQVRVEGLASQLPAAVSDAYFASRPRGSQIGAHASPQSEVLPDRTSLEAREQSLAARFADQNVPRPEHWGGYCVKPHYFEFWQGRPSRLHDRLVYLPDAAQPQGWKIQRLAP